MNQLTESSITCPYCGETLEVLIDAADLNQQYIEDCQVCCQPITFLLSESDNGKPVINVYSENETF